MKKVRVRYAPSPTGHLHIGGARTALFNYLFAKHYDGDFIIRIEDTDIARNVEHGEENQITGLSWMGIDADESPSNPNPKYAPYRQMERLNLYSEIAEKLVEMGHAYKCYCTTEELEEDYEKQKEAGHASTRYSLKCYHLSEEEKKHNEEAGLEYTIRLHVPENKTYEFDDLIRGHVSFESKDMGDWVLVKQNGIPTYNFAVVVDDYTMEITHVFRGEEHLSNTPKQLMIYEMLGWEAPTFGHMTLIVNEDHKKLSKRDESIMQFIEQYQKAGYLPEAMFNFLSLLGWSPASEQEIFTHDELVKQFDEKRLSKSPSMFDKDKLTWINKEYLKKLSDEEMIALCKPYLLNNEDTKHQPDEWLNAVILLFREQLGYGEQIVDLSQLFTSEPELSDEVLDVFGWETTPTVIESFLRNFPAEYTPENLKEVMNVVKKETGIKGKPLFMGVRAVTSHQVHGPDLNSTLVLLGEDKVKARCQAYLDEKA